MVIERLVQAKSMFGTVRFKNPIVIAGMRVILIQDEPTHRLQAGDLGILLKENLEPGDDGSPSVRLFGAEKPIHQSLLGDYS